MRSVFVVSHGEAHSGSGVISVHFTHEGAVEAALTTKCYFEGAWEPDGEDEWVNGCDYVMIREYKVKE